jgi:hypothetical protein
LLRRENSQIREIANGSKTNPGFRPYPTVITCNHVLNNQSVRGIG